MKTGFWGNAFLAITGGTAAFLSRSDALLVDALYSLVNVGAALAATRIGARVGGPATRKRPWGHDFDEVLYVTFRSLILIGILIFALILAGTKIVTFFTGGAVPELAFGPIEIYAVLLVAVCAALAVNYRIALRRSENRSAILKAETRTALIDGALSLGTGLVLLSLPHLKGTPLAPYTPIGDAVLVIVLVSIIIWSPLKAFRTTLADLAAVSAPSKTVAAVGRAARALSAERGYKYQRSAVLQAGRMHFAAIYIDPLKPVLATDVDTFRDTLTARLEDVIGPTRVEVMLTAQSGPLPRGQTA
nr:cation transporter [Roseibium sp. RKSG952]